MIRYLLASMTLALAGACAVGAATNRATVSLHCLSLRFQPATAKFFGQTYTLEFTTANDQDPANGELTPNGTGSSSHACFYKLYLPDWPDPTIGTFYLNIPDPVDANGDGFNDFFEVSQAVPAAKTSGTSEDILGQGTVETTWTRPASSGEGTCVVNLQEYGLVFTHQFELFEYDGKLNYTLSGTNVAGLVDLVQTNATTNTLKGPAAFTVVNTNQVELQIGGWTNAANETLTYDVVESYGRQDNLYYGFVDFTDFDPSTPTADYRTWVMLITDPTDANGNGIPDLSDTAPMRAPALSLRPATNELWLSLSGDIGRAYDIEATVTLTSPQWNKVTSITLTNDPQVVKLSWPTDPTRFWRGRVR